MFLQFPDYLPMAWDRTPVATGKAEYILAITEIALVVIAAASANTPHPAKKVGGYIWKKLRTPRFQEGRERDAGDCESGG